MGKRSLAEEDPIERIAQRVRSLKHDEIAELGRLPLGVRHHWINLKSDRLIITRERRDHLFSSHSETRDLLRSVLETVLDPDEIHRNKSDVEMAIFWRSLDEEKRYHMRAAVWLPVRDGLAASVISARKTRREDFVREERQGRLIWKRTT
jgi:hypothetical protein